MPNTKQFEGSPPQVRVKVKGKINWLIEERITPAGAGKSNFFHLKKTRI